MLVAAVAGAGLVAWWALRDRGDKSGAPKVAATDERAQDPWAGEPEGSPGLRRRPVSGLRTRQPGPPAQVSGVVRLAGAGTPVAGAEVAFMNESGESTVTADGSGRYTALVATGVRWKVHARTDEAVGYPESVEVSAAGLTRDLEVQALATVRGRVIDGLGAVVPGADVNIEVTGSDRNLLESAVALSTQSDDAGRFELRALAGSAKVRAARGMTQGLATIASMAPGATVDVEVRVQAPVRVHGIVVDRESRPQGGATIKALAALEPGIGYERKQVTVDASGAFELEMPAGWVRLEASVGGERAPVWSQSIAAGATVDDVRLVVSPGEILHGRVVTADGSAVVGARVRLVSAAGYSTFDASSGGDGRFELSVPERGGYVVKVRHSEGYAQRQVDAWGEAEQFVMQRFGRLVIKVAGATSDARVQIDQFVPAGEAAPRAPAEASFRGGRDSIAVENLEPGHYKLTVSAAGNAPVGVEVDVPAEGTAQLDVKLEPAPINPSKLGAVAVRQEARPC